jgi:hypothetical protein
MAIDYFSLSLCRHGESRPQHRGCSINSLAECSPCQRGDACHANTPPVLSLEYLWACHSSRERGNEERKEGEREDFKGKECADRDKERVKVGRD